MKNRIIKIDQHIGNWGWLAEIMDYTTRQALAIQAIPAPTFHEAARAAYVEEVFKQLELADIQRDAVFNVYGRLPGSNAALPAVMVSAHTDTVFPQESDLNTRQDGDVIYGPGLGDNSFGVAAMLGLVAAVRAQGWQLERDVWLVATTGEEGLGDLGGMKAAYDFLKDRLGCVINLEGLAFGHVYHAAIAVRRWHITASAPGGHSWLHFGRSSATHGIIELGAGILSIKPPQSPRTTYNIGQLEGGQGINVIATEAGLWLDMRSEEQSSLNHLERQVLDQIKVLTSPELKFNVQVVGDRPAGRIAVEHELVQGALAALAQVGVQGTLETGSTDANIPLSEGCPAVTIGIVRGGNAHRLDEYVELAPLEQGMRQLILLTLAAGDFKP